MVERCHPLYGRGNSTPRNPQPRTMAPKPKTINRPFSRSEETIAISLVRASGDSGLWALYSDVVSSSPGNPGTMPRRPRKMRRVDEVSRGGSSLLATDEDLPEDLAEVEKGRVFYLLSPQPPVAAPHNSALFDTQQNFVYEPFDQDFGPPNLAMITAFCRKLYAVTSDKKRGPVCIRVESHDSRSHANWTLIMAAYQMLCLGRSIEDSLQPFKHLHLSPALFTDTTGSRDLALSVSEVLEALAEGIRRQWYSFDTFDVTEFEKYEQVDEGDMNWIIPHELMAMATPRGENKACKSYGALHCTPEFYLPLFEKFGIKTLVRLSRPVYEARRFTDSGINFVDASYPDGTCPPHHILLRVLNVLLENDHGVALHCRSGLGRTGTLAGAYLMLKYNFTARMAVAWMRLCRPGMVVGCQLMYLDSLEKEYAKFNSTSSSLSRADTLELPRSRSKRKRESSDSIDSDRALSSRLSTPPIDRVTTVELPRPTSNPRQRSTEDQDEEHISLKASMESIKPKMSRTTARQPRKRLEKSRYSLRSAGSLEGVKNTSLSRMYQTLQESSRRQAK